VRRARIPTDLLGAHCAITGSLSLLYPYSDASRERRAQQKETMLEAGDTRNAPPCAMPVESCYQERRRGDTEPTDRATFPKANQQIGKWPGAWQQ
jgi:hypothetical protein